MVAWRSARSWRARGWIRVLAVALPLLLLPVAVWPSLLGPSFEADPPPSRVVVLASVYLGCAALAWLAFRLRISVSRGLVRVTNAGRTTVFAADDVLAVQPTARGVRFVIEGRDPVIAYAVPCPAPSPGQRPRWLDVAEAVAGEDPARVAIIRGRAVGAGVRSVSADARTTAYRFSGSGLGAEVAVCRRALGLLRPRLDEVVVTTGPTDDWPPDLSAEVAARIGRQRRRRARPLGGRTGRPARLTLDVALDRRGHRDSSDHIADTAHANASFALLLRLTPWVVALEARSLSGSPAGAVFDRCRDARFLLTDLEHEDLLASVLEMGLGPQALVLDRPRRS